jgi:hypothetical protein
MEGCCCGIKVTPKNRHICKDNKRFIALPVETGNPLAQEQNRITHNCLFQVHFFIALHVRRALWHNLPAGRSGVNIG